MPMLSSKHSRAPCVGAVVALGASLSLPAWAGRPLSTEDAGTNSQAQCQLEAWMNSAADGRQTHLAPACGLVDGLELGLEMVKASPSDALSQGRSIALKWAPDWLEWHGWRFGAKISSAHEKAPDDTKWRQASMAALGIATYAISPDWTVHLNLGRQRDKLQSIGSTTPMARHWSGHRTSAGSSLANSPVTTRQPPFKPWACAGGPCPINSGWIWPPAAPMPRQTASPGALGWAGMASSSEMV